MTNLAPRRLTAGVLGANGFTGTELIRLLEAHPDCTVGFATSRSRRGESLREIDPSAPDLRLVDPEDAKLSAVDVAFSCLPHGSSAGWVKRAADAGARVVDLSGDLRLSEPAAHEKHYGSPRDAELAASAVYGLTELVREELPAARVVANPGCYPTCVGLALAPLARAGWLRAETPVVNAVSGVSGAGRSPSPATHFCAVADDVRPYKLGHGHRHVAEMEQCLARWAPQGQQAGPVLFNPHVGPFERGMLATIVLRRPAGDGNVDVRALLADAWSGEPFIELLPAGSVARVRAAARSNKAVLAVEDVPETGHVVVTSAIDNLLKGAAGQAVQNMNLMFGLEETTGLAPLASGPARGEK